MTTFVSADANGIANVAASAISDNAMATITNPGQLGILSLTDNFIAATFLTGTNLNMFGSSYIETLNASAVNVGFNLEGVFHGPFQLGIGAG